MKLRFYYTILKIAFIVLVPFVLIFLPADFFDTGRSLCVSKLLFNTECYACGMSGACMHLIHFEFEEAFAYNMASFITLPVLGILWIVWFFREWKRFRQLQAQAGNPTA